MTAKKVKDLKKGDRLWFYNFTDTTPIFVEKVKRIGDFVEVVIRWDDHEYVGCGHALGFIVVSYDRRIRRDNILFTSNFDDVRKREQNDELKEAERELGHNAMLFFKQLNKTKNIIINGKREEIF